MAIVKKAPAKGSRVGDDLVAAFEEMAAHMRGEIKLEAHEVPIAQQQPRRHPEVLAAQRRASKD